MSFSLTRTYPRHILAPISLSESDEARASLSKEHHALHGPVQLAQSTSRHWHATTHTFTGTGDRVVPACWPPSRFSEDPCAIPDDDKYDALYSPASAQPRADGLSTAVYHLYGSNAQQDKTTEHNRMPAPRIVVKRITPTAQIPNAQRNITLLMLPGMGAPKEVFEPLIEALLPQLQRAGVNVAEIWTLDMPMSGQTALVNPQGYLYGNEKDIARDLLLFITAYLPVEAGGPLPQQALTARTDVSKDRQKTRTDLHVVAHSLGAQSAILCAAHAPDLFASLAVFDPAMLPFGSVTKIFTRLGKDVFCTMLSERYTSRASLEAAVTSNKRLRGWDDRIVKAFSAWGTIPDTSDPTDGAVRLSARPRLEWALYYDKETPTQCFDRLPDVTCPFYALMPERPFGVPPQQVKDVVAAMLQPTRVTWFPATSHQLPFERVDEGMHYVAQWLIERTQGEQRALPSRL